MDLVRTTKGMGRSRKDVPMFAIVCESAAKWRGIKTANSSGGSFLRVT